MTTAPNGGWPSRATVPWNPRLILGAIVCMYLVDVFYIQIFNWVMSALPKETALSINNLGPLPYEYFWFTASFAIGYLPIGLVYVGLRRKGARAQTIFFPTGENKELAPFFYYLVIVAAGVALTASTKETYWLAVTVLVLAPITEEFIFRGLLFPSLAKRVGASRAAIVSSIVFMLAPGHISQGLIVLPGIFIMGMLCCWIYEAKRNLWWSVMMHAAKNLHFIVLLAGRAAH